jgi:NAD+ synthase
VARVTETGLPLLYVNQIGGQDELVFDGASFVLNADRTLAVQTAGLGGSRHARHRCSAPATAGAASRVPRALIEEKDSAAYHACMLGLRDYVDKNGFPGVVLGLSGGIDSALVAALATDALGPAARALRDAALSLHLERQPERRRRMRQGAGVRYDIVPIAEPVEGFTKALAKMFEAASPTSRRRTSKPACAARR